MPVKELTEKTYLVMDNSVLSMLTEWYCGEARGLGSDALLNEVQRWLLEQIAMLQSFAVDNLLHTSTAVSEEYKPWHEDGSLRKRGVESRKIQMMASAIRGRFAVQSVDAGNLTALRTLPGVNTNLAKKLTDQDLSLIRVALALTIFGQKVYILTNDQDLLQFISWVRTQVTLRSPTVNPLLLEGLSGLTFIDLVHRECSISSDQMLKMIGFVINDTNERMRLKDPMALGEEKGTKIITNATKMLSSAFLESMKIKMQRQGVAA